VLPENFRNIDVKLKVSNCAFDFAVSFKMSLIEAILVEWLAAAPPLPLPLLTEDK
jgi:hypothetical protein